MAKAAVKKSSIETPMTKSVARRVKLMKGESLVPHPEVEEKKEAPAKPAPKKRRTKAEIEAEKKAKAERKAAIAKRNLLVNRRKQKKKPR